MDISWLMGARCFGLLMRPEPLRILCQKAVDCCATTSRIRNRRVGGMVETSATQSNSRFDYHALQTHHPCRTSIRSRDGVHLGNGIVVGSSRSGKRETNQGTGRRREGVEVDVCHNQHLTNRYAKPGCPRPASHNILARVGRKPRRGVPPNE